MNYLVVDPGLKHTCVMFLRVDNGNTPHVMINWTNTFDLSGKVNPDKDKANKLVEEIRLNVCIQLIDEILIEFQPPLNTRTNPALVRWNSWIEGYMVGALGRFNKPITYVHSMSVKRKFGTVGHIHSVNKSLSIREAKKYMGKTELRHDHEADCVLMGVYQFLKKQNQK